MCIYIYREENYRYSAAVRDFFFFSINGRRSTVRFILPDRNISSIRYTGRSLVRHVFQLFTSFPFFRYVFVCMFFFLSKPTTQLATTEIRFRKFYTKLLFPFRHGRAPRTFDRKKGISYVIPFLFISRRRGTL